MVSSEQNRGHFLFNQVVYQKKFTFKHDRKLHVQKNQWFFLLVPAFKHIPEGLYASLPVTVIALIARVALSNAVLGQCLMGLSTPLLMMGRKSEEGGRQQ